MRGKVSMPLGEIAKQRITPAYAGKSVSPTINKGFKQDHPRVCGEKCKVSPEKPEELGSPPRMRGKD